MFLGSSEECKTLAACWNAAAATAVVELCTLVQRDAAVERRTAWTVWAAVECSRTLVLTAGRWESCSLVWVAAGMMCLVGSEGMSLVTVVARELVAAAAAAESVVATVASERTAAVTVTMTKSLNFVNRSTRMVTEMWR